MFYILEKYGFVLEKYGYLQNEKLKKMIVKTFGSCVVGVHAIPITIEVSVENGINFYLVGLPDSAVRESQQRIDSALSSNGYRIPGKRIIVNMAPADLRKEGAAYDLPIAIGILAASGQIAADKIDSYVIMGELSLDGMLQPIKGALPIAIEAKNQGFKGIVLPHDNAPEAAVVNDLEVIGVQNICQVIDFFNGKPVQPIPKPDFVKLFGEQQSFGLDFEDVKGQENAKRALEIASAGGHNVIFIGPPGSGKSMLAQRMPSILPPMTLEEALETTKIHSVAGKMQLHQPLIVKRPFRSPHHTVSDVAMVGGGSTPQPGEISLAHNGILFLDELPEFKRSVLEVLRQPLEERYIRISRAKMTVEFPASFIFVAAMNPCPCGYYNHPQIECTCSPGAVKRYLGRISGPLLDRIDIHIEVTPVPISKLSNVQTGESSEIIRARVQKARDIQAIRFKLISNVHCNAHMDSKMTRKYCKLSDKCRQIIELAMNRLGFSARAYDRILKVSRTIADLEGCSEILPQHLQEAIMYRSLDRESWGG